ncbi:PPOX class F420-dependent oxidoreductase [Microlunatus sp. Gsoil 973]|uniref:PPOX class F420-dependent oxidoreductase n=1 Tax=Microlunatus sp. Gsoil 973 TaxID=2672569 RepID=UPI0012B4FFB2|nr:PPOX class F420-dependent oxidoreductase [Microlunatus sp. Gsoil 973]QGN31807.1 TIGR03618 family F420-dependent PPOX class oxidoreductase [Microlunatus sp. Gsoil 973]
MAPRSDLNDQNSQRLLAAFGDRGNCALATIGRNCRPQITNVSYAFDLAMATFRVSLTETRVKTRNLRRDPRASFYITAANRWPYTVADGTAELSPVAADPADPTVEALIDLYRAVSGKEHPDWDEYRQAMVTDRRLVLTVRVDHVYGMPE